jgi:hypothetical protein
MTSNFVKKHVSESEQGNRRNPRKTRLLIIGIIIVIATFIVAHVLRGQLKAISDSIDTAQNRASTSEIQQTLSTRQRQLSALEQEMLGAQNVLAHPAIAPVISASDIQGEISDLQHSYSDAAVELEQTSLLVDTTAKVGKGAHGVRDWRERIRKNFEGLRTEVNDTATKNLVPNPAWQNHVSVLLTTAKVLVLRVDVALWETSVNSVAQQHKEIADKMYKICAWLSYLFYALGILVALKGQFSDAKEK